MYRRGRVSVLYRINITLILLLFGGCATVNGRNGLMEAMIRVHTA
jgi:hypothetical protein